jgi:hypothetical protein
MSTLTLIVIAVVVIAIIAIVLIALSSRRSRLRPLPAEERSRLATAWRDVETRFVDSPQQAVSEADRLVVEAFHARGGREDDLPRDVREARELARRGDGESMTENLRRAMQNYRGAMENMLGADPRDEAIRNREVAS